MLAFIKSIDNAKFERLMYRGVVVYAVLHMLLLYTVQFQLFDYYIINVLGTFYMLYFLFMYVFGLASGKVINPMGNTSKANQRFPRGWFRSVDVVVIALAIWCVVSTVFAYDKEIALYGAETRNEGLLEYFVYYLLFYGVSFLSDKSKKKICKVLSVGGLIMLISGLVFCFTGLSGDLFGRPMACVPFLHQNTYGAFAAMYVVLHMVYAFWGQNSKMKWYVWIAIFVGMLAVFGSKSSLAYIAFILAFAFAWGLSILFSRKQGKTFWKKMLVGSVVMVLLFVIAIPIVDFASKGLVSEDVEFVESLAEEEGANGALNGRIDFWMDGIRALPKYWLTGVGIDNYEKIVKDDPIPNLYAGRTAHNEYLQMACTVGVPALCLYLVILFIVFFKGLRTWKAEWDENTILYHGLYLAFFAYIAQAFVSFSAVALVPIFWICMGMLIKNDKDTINEKLEGEL